MSRLGGVSLGVWLVALRRSVCRWRRVRADRVGRGGIEDGFVRKLGGEEFGVREFGADSESVVTRRGHVHILQTGVGHGCEVSDRCGELGS